MAKQEMFVLELINLKIMTILVKGCMAHHILMHIGWSCVFYDSK